MFGHSKHPAREAHHKARSSAAAKQMMAQMPIAFEALPDGRFLAKSMGHSVLLDSQSAVWRMHGGSNIQMEFRNANKSAPRHGVDRLKARVDRYIGNDKSKWRTNIPTFQKVAYDSVYPGVDLVFYGKGGKMEHDFIVAPHADPKQIQLAFAGASKMQLDGQGNLNLESGSSPDHLELTKPIAYQTLANGTRSEVDVKFTASADHSVSFDLGHYDADRPLVIDPVVLYSTYYGGSGEDEFVALAADLNSDSVWIVGSTDSSDIITNGGGLNGTQATAGRDILVAQFVGAGSGQLTIAYSSTMGGTLDDEPTAIGVAPNGFVYIVGSTGSVDFPSVNPFNSTFQGLSDGFIVGIDPTQLQTPASAIIYATFLGGTATDWITCMTFDQNSILYVGGYTLSLDFPTSAGAILAGNRGGYDPFAAQIDPTAGSSGLLYSTTYGGSSTDEGTGIAVDNNGIIYLSGWTDSSDFPVSAPITGGNVPFQSNAGQADGFLVAIDPTQSGVAGIVWCTYFGGSDWDQPNAMQFAPNGQLIIAGYTASTDFPMVGNSLQPRNAGGYDMFITAWDFTQKPSQWLVYSTYLGSSDDDVLNGMSIDPQGRINLIGYTSPASYVPGPNAVPFPTTANAVQPVSGGLEEAIIARIDLTQPGAQALTFSTFWGGPGNDVGLGVFADPRGCFVYATGSTGSRNMLVVPYAFQTQLTFTPDAFLINIDTCSNPSPSGSQ
jgi:hypothetical protein